MTRHALCLALMFGLTLFACRRVPRYIVTTSPLNIVGVGHPGLCVAVDPNDSKGVWWWEPGRSGCSSRSTGPTAFRADAAAVAASPSGTIDVHFQVQMQVGAPRAVGLVLQDGGMRVVASGERVPTERRNDIDLPEQPPYR